MSALDDRLVDPQVAVNGTCIQNNDKIAPVRGIVSPADFTNMEYGRTFAAICDCVDASVPADAITVLRYAITRKVYQGDRQRIGALLKDSMRFLSSSANAEHYAQQIADSSAERSRFNSAQSLMDSIAQNDPDSTQRDILDDLNVRFEQRSGVSVGVTGRDLMDGDTITPAEPLIQGFNDRGNRGWLVGDSEKGKSLVAMYIAACAAGGITIAGKWPVPEPIKTAMLFLEDRPMPDGTFPPRIKWRYRCIIDGLRNDGEDESTIDLVLDNMLLWCGDNYHNGLAKAREHGSRLTFIDSWNVVCPDDSVDTRGRNEIRRLMDSIHAELDNEAYFLLDHTNKHGGKDDNRSDKDRQYGSSGKHQVADVVFMLKPSDPIYDEVAGEDELAVTLLPIKARDGCNIVKSGCVLHWKGMPVNRKLPMDKIVPLSLEYSRDNAESQDLGQISTNKKRIKWDKATRLINVTEGKRTVAQIAEELETTSGTVYRWIKDPDSPFKSLGDGSIGLKNG